MKNWTIAKRLRLGFAALVAITIAMGALSYERLLSIDATSDTITEDALPGVELISKVDAQVREQRAYLLRHVITSDPKRKQELEQEMAEITHKIDEGFKEYEATIHQPEDRRLFEAVIAARTPYRQLRDDVVMPLSRQDKDVEAEKAIDTQLDPLYQAYINALAAEVNFNSKYSKQQAGAINDILAFTKTAIIVSIVLALLISGVLSYLIIRSINTALGTSLEQLGEGATQVVSAAGQVSTSSQALSQGATEQAASLEETSASMEEMASMTRQNAENSEQAATLMSDVDKRVQESDAALGEMVNSMTAIQESSQKVSRIIKTIDEIAFQTNILALNAAVEAARAGEAGMGFAVVADEVRNLAQRSAQAAKDTAQLIEESIDKTQTGVAKVTQVSGAIAGITESVSKVKGLVDEVSIASRQQTQGIDQVTQAVAQMEKVTQTTAATAEESAAASEELNAQAEQTMHIVQALNQLVGTSTTSAPVRGASTVHAAASVANKVVRLARPAASPKPSAKSAEEQIPLEGTGTYGSF